MIQINHSKKENHVLLTERDVRLLDLLYDHGMMSLSQMERYVFAAKSWPTILNRVGRLEEAGYVKRLKVARLRHPADGKQVGVLLRIASRGLAEIAKLRPEKTFDEALTQIKSVQLDHDLLLVDVIEKLKRANPVNTFIEGRRFVRGNSEIHRVPDSVMVDASTKQTTAIELELTGKSEKRYRNIILNYRLMKSFEKVLFITASNAITWKIQSQILGYKVQSSQDLDTGKFSFRALSELLQEKPKAA